MLKKLLKYDLKSVFKYWWIAAVTTFCLSFAAGGCITVLRSEKELPTVVNILSGFTVFLVIAAFCVFSVLSAVFVFFRFYKNFFTDEGYLTFTLPVKRSSLLNSKLYMGGIVEFATVFTLGINFLTMILIGYGDKIFTEKFIRKIIELVKDIVDQFGVYTALYILEMLLIFVLIIVFSVLLLYVCITLASMISKKAKVITAIGIYYGVNMIVSFVFQIFTLFGYSGIAERFAKLDINVLKPTLALTILGIMVAISVFCAMLYTLQYWMLDRKLNLS